MKCLVSSSYFYFQMGVVEGNFVGCKDLGFSTVEEDLCLGLEIASSVEPVCIGLGQILWD